MNKVILYELNEVPFKIFNHFASQMPDSAVAKLRMRAKAFETFAEDSGHLSPWITWPTLHRGVINDKHEITDFGQDLRAVNNEYPPVWEILCRGGVKVGLFGSLHSYPLPDNVFDYAFYVPDTFAAGPECFPEKYEAFQRFNLRMAGENGAQVNSSIALKDAARFVAAAPSLGLSARTGGQVLLQLASERLNRNRVVRRRTTQAQIAFDFFLKALSDEQPDFSLFFTNHVASSMHRYWPALFPADYRKLEFDDAWLSRWSGEIPFAMREAEYQLRQLMRFVEQNSGYKLVVATSMGQAAVQGRERVDRTAIINGFARLMAAFDIDASSWERRPAMVPQYNVYVAEGARDRFLNSLRALTINGRGIEVMELGDGVFRLNFALSNQRDLQVEYAGSHVDPAAFGIVNVEMQDAAGANAYHIPQGMLLIYEPNAKLNSDRTPMSVSTLDATPSLLRNFGIEPPSYMQRGFKI